MGQSGMHTAPAEQSAPSLVTCKTNGHKQRCVVMRREAVE